jgi:hypothetical protein
MEPRTHVEVCGFTTKMFRNNELFLVRVKGHDNQAFSVYNKALVDMVKETRVFPVGVYLVGTLPRSKNQTGTVQRVVDFQRS